MTEDARLMFKIAELTLHSLNGTLDDSGLRQLQELLETHPAAIEYYQEILLTHVGLKSMEGIACLQETDDTLLDSNFWKMMLEQEKTAPAIEIPVEEPQRQLIRKVVHPQLERVRISRFQKIFFVCNVAAVLMVVAFLMFAPSPQTAVMVATLDDSIEAVWDDTFPMPDSYGEMAQSRYRLEKGFASIRFNDGARVTLEAPAELSLNSADDMELFSGKIYAIVPNRAQGFTVKAGRSKIVDMGTEFGVEVDSSGNAQLHVTKGRTILFAGLKSGEKDQVIVDEGSARKIYSDGFVKEVPLENERFARRVDSKSNFVLREMRLSLADLIGGGNGFDAGNRKQAIDPLTGRLTSDAIFEFRQGENRFFPVEDAACIDGVFVPDGGNGPVTVSTAGHPFENCIDTSGGCYRNISNYFQRHKDDDPDDIEAFERGLMNGVLYGTAEKPAISMHANTGITFDLDRIRKSIPDVRVSSFSALCGIAGEISRMLDYTATFYVLVDGQKKFEISGFHKELLDIPVKIKLSDRDRFLTLIAADGGGGSVGRDWCMFAMPVLELEDRK